MKNNWTKLFSSFCPIIPSADQVQNPVFAADYSFFRLWSGLHNLWCTIALLNNVHFCNHFIYWKNLLVMFKLRRGCCVPTALFCVTLEGGLRRKLISQRHSWYWKHLKDDVTISMVIETEGKMSIFGYLYLRKRKRDFSCWDNPLSLIPAQLLFTVPFT